MSWSIEVIEIELTPTFSIKKKNSRAIFGKEINGRCSFTSLYPLGHWRYLYIGFRTYHLRDRYGHCTLGGPTYGAVSKKPLSLTLSLLAELIHVSQRLSYAYYCCTITCSVLFVVLRAPGCIIFSYSYPYHFILVLFEICPTGFFFWDLAHWLLIHHNFMPTN